MNHTQVLTALVAVIVGAVGGYLLGADQRATPNTQTNEPMHHGMQSEMSGMMAALEGKRGDEFDRAFLEEMIVHHEGALDMAEAAKLYAERAEIKTMADAIISTQTAEIEQMQAWQRAWFGAR